MRTLKSSNILACLASPCWLDRRTRASAAVALFRVATKASPCAASIRATARSWKTWRAPTRHSGSSREVSGSSALRVRLCLREQRRRRSRRATWRSGDGALKIQVAGLVLGVAWWFTAPPKLTLGLRGMPSGAGRYARLLAASRFRSRCRCSDRLHQPIGQRAGLGPAFAAAPLPVRKLITHSIRSVRGRRSAAGRSAAASRRRWSPGLAELRLGGLESPLSFSCRRQPGALAGFRAGTSEILAR